MGALLESGKVGNVGMNKMREVRADVIDRWSNLGLLEGLEGYKKENIAQLYENQASYLLNEATSIGSEGSFETVVFPIVRRVFSKLLANEIVSVQALNLPIGKLFYFIPKVGKVKYKTDYEVPIEHLKLTIQEIKWVWFKISMTILIPMISSMVKMVCMTNQKEVQHC